MHQKLTKKLFKLFTGELTATIMFGGVWLLFLRMHEWANPYFTSFPPLYAFLFLEFLLLQGSYYWYLKWRQAKHRDFTILPDYHLKFFRILKRVNLFLIGVGFVILIYESINHSKAYYWTLFLYLFALAEYINYYYIRLSYQSVDEMKDFLRHRKLRRSKLAEELKQLKAISQ